MLSGILFLAGCVLSMVLFGVGVNAFIDGIEATSRWENFYQ